MKLKAASLVCALLLWTAIGGCPTSDLGGDNLVPGGTTPSGSDTGGDNGNSTGDQGGSQDNGSAGDNGSTNDGGTTGDQNTGNDGADTGDGSSNTGDNNGAGGGDGNTGGGADLSAFTGTFSGQLACTKSESVQGGAGPEEDWTANLTLTFDADGYPTGLVVPAYMQNTHDMLEFTVAVAQVGDEDTQTGTAGEYTATLTASVTEATYTATTGHIVLALTHHGTQGALTEDGTGTLTVDYTLSGDQLTYHAVTAYEVTMTNVISLDTTWGLDCTGTLTRQ